MGNVSVGPVAAADLYWLAGLIEGEGCFSLHKASPSRPNRRPYLTVSVQMTDKDVVDRVAGLMNSSVTFYESRNARCAPVYRTQVTGARAAEWMQRLKPHMGQRRTARINELLLTRGLSHA